jgi:glycosyltransferase involved in cell wall biosynthesis
VISVVVPMRDEERTVEPLYEELASALDGRDEPWEAIFVDDGSRDGTAGALVRLHEETANVKFVRLRRNVGKAAALDAGFREVEGETVVTIDGDLQDVIDSLRGGREVDLPLQERAKPA